MLLEGPNKNYTFSGYSTYSAKASFNSVRLNVLGGKTVTFPDGTKIYYNNQQDQFNNTFIGTLGHQIAGKVEFTDEKNGITAFYDIGHVKKK